MYCNLASLRMMDIQVVSDLLLETGVQEWGFESNPFTHCLRKVIKSWLMA